MKSLACVVLGIGLAVPALGGVAAAADQPPLAGSLAGSAPAPEAAAAAPLALEADGVTFGMSSDQVAKLYDRWWDRHFVPKYQKTNPGPKTKELDYQLEEQKKILRRVTPFDGRTTTFDKAEFREEFAHGNGETMSSTKVLRRGAGSDSKSVSYVRRFFFFNDKLWKIYDEYRLEAQGPFGADFKEATNRVAASLGPTAKRTRAPASSAESVAFEAPSERVRVLKLSGERVAVVRADSALTKSVLDARAQHPVAKEEGVDEDTSAALR
ncbi:MAG TPA: hypothetical protein VJU61_02735 [Polyangiaceae bacterium]|nr:hypothetical protein [Polyangiaceae bacterium]